MNLNTFKHIFIIIFRTKLIFKKPKKAKLLFFDASHTKLLINKFKIKIGDYEVLNSRLESINIPILIKTIKKNIFNLSLKIIIYNILKLLNQIKLSLLLITILFFINLKNIFQI